MNNRHNARSGFVWLPVLLGVLAILVISGGAYWYTQQKQAADSVFKPVAAGTYLSTATSIDQSSDFSRIKFEYLRKNSSVVYVEHGVLHDLPAADFPTFLALSGSVTDTDPWALDKNNVYYLGQIILGADPNSFHLLNGYGYSADTHAVYWDAMAIPDADLATFVAGYPTNKGHYDAARDKNHIYCDGQAYPLDSTQCVPPPAQTTFSASPTSGVAPLTVTFDTAFLGMGEQWVDFGDGARADAGCVQYKSENDCIKMKPITHTYTTAGDYTASYKERDSGADKIWGTATISVTGPSEPTVSTPGMSKYTNATLGITFYAPPGLQSKTASPNGSPSNFDYCINMINPSDIGKNYPGDDGNWVTICKKQTSLFAEQGYWGDTVYYYFDAVKNQWMYAVQGTGSDQPGSASTATTTAKVEATTLAGDPIFVGTGAHSCISRIVPTSNTTFLYIRDRFCGDYDPTSFISRFAQTFDRIGETPDSTRLQQALQNELTAVATYAH